MALNLAGLQSALAANFASPAATISACAKQWADAIADYASGIVPASTTIGTAGATLRSALAAAFATPAAAAGMEAAFTAFATSVGAGMVGFAPVPPPGPVGFVAGFAGPKPTTHAAAANQYGALIDTWMKTGSSTLIAPPNTIVPWS